MGVGMGGMNESLKNFSNENTRGLILKFNLDLKGH